MDGPGYGVGKRPFLVAKTSYAGTLMVMEAPVCHM